MTVVYLDAYHLGDPLFVSGLARDLAARPAGVGLVLVHGSGEHGERALEALGQRPAAREGVWLTDGPGAEAVERALRELNRQIVHELNEQGVVSIRALGVDRGMVRQCDGRLEAGRVAWVREMVERGVVVVVGSLVGDSGEAIEADPARVAGVLAASLGGTVFVLATRPVPEDEPQDDAAGLVSDPSIVPRLRETGAPVRFGARVSLRAL